ncbi:MAG: hypothetical protein KatS3mg002_0963 [Candidatus Woesearchaeota archaeon]|nr:MAG: hypothetical protein KatS3mg002_0963 [Candidatus Woesearchaeota archaeon]
MFSSFVLAAFPPDNILKPGWNNIIGLWGESVDEETVPGMFGYTLKGWEVNVCSQHVTGNLLYRASGGFSGISTDLSKIYDTTATLQAMKTVYNESQSLIEVAWYIQPKFESEYNIYLLKGNTKLVIVPNRFVDPFQGETGYVADYYDISYDYAVLAYKSGEEILKQKIVVLNE